MKLEDVDEARASWMKLEMICIQLCQGAVSVGCTDKPCIVDSVPDHMVVVAFQKLAAFIPVVVQEPNYSFSDYSVIEIENVNSLELIEMGDMDNTSNNFFYASLELKSE